MTLLSLAVTQILIRLFNFIIIQVFQLNFACISAGNKFPPGMNTDRQIQFPPCWCHLTAEWHGNSRVGPDAEGRDVMSRRGFIPLITQTSPLPNAGDSAGKGQPSGSHKDQLAMHVTAPAGPASALPTLHFLDRTNASTRLLIAPKMPQWCLLTRP